MILYGSRILDTMYAVEGRAVPVCGFRQVAPAVVNQVMALLGIPRIATVRDASQLFPYTCLVTVYAITVGERFIQRIVEATVPFHPVSCCEFQCTGFVVVENDSQRLTPYSMILNTKCNFHFVIEVLEFIVFIKNSDFDWFLGNVK